MVAPTDPPMQPWDEHNQKLLSHVHPNDWKNPVPDGRYNLVVVGGGTAGLVSAAGAAGLGAKVALVEKHLLGGDCLNVGCVPSKALLRAARASAAVREAVQFGVKVPDGSAVDFQATMERLRRLRANISPHDSAQRFTSLGVDVYLGGGTFTGPDQLQVAGQTLTFAKAVITTGARAAAPPLPGLQDVPYLTNETLFSLTERPRRLGIIGAGPIGCEMAQAFARLGTEVFLVTTESGVLPKDDRDAAALVQQSLTRDGVTFLPHGKDLTLKQDPEGIRMRVENPHHGYDVLVDQLLVATGRAPNIEGLGLETAGVAFTKKGVTVSDHLQTSNPRIYAAGDVCSSYQFTHAADFMARIVIQNALFMGHARASSLLIPWATYTSPEVAHVGLSHGDAETQGIAIDTYTQPMNGVDRAILDSETRGFVRIHTGKGTDQILGATVVAEHAGDLISEITLAMKNKIGLKAISSTIHPYPTQADAIRKVGDLYNRTRLTPLVKGLMKRWLQWTR